PEVVTLVDDELVYLQERAGIEQQLQSLARRLLSRLVLAPDAILTAAQLRLRVSATQLFESVRPRHGPTVSIGRREVNGFIHLRRDPSLNTPRFPPIIQPRCSRGSRSS